MDPLWSGSEKHWEKDKVFYKVLKNIAYKQTFRQTWNLFLTFSAQLGLECETAEIKK